MSFLHFIYVVAEWKPSIVRSPTALLSSTTSSCALSHKNLVQDMAGRWTLYSSWLWKIFSNLSSHERASHLCYILNIYVHILKDQNTLGNFMFIYLLLVKHGNGTMLAYRIIFNLILIIIIRSDNSHYLQYWSHIPERKNSYLH